MKKSILNNMVLALVGAAAMLSCKKKDDAPASQEALKYSVAARVDEVPYFIQSNDLTTGKLSVVGNGSELPGAGGWNTYKDGYYYIVNWDENTFDQYKVTATGYEKLASMSTATLLSGKWPRIPEITSDGDLLWFSDSGEDGDIAYALIKIPEFTVKKKDVITLPKYKQLTAVMMGHGLVNQGKIYMGMHYTNPLELNGKAPNTIFPDSLMVAVYNYPSFTFDKMLYYPGTGGDMSRWRQKVSALDESGDIYLVNGTTLQPDKDWKTVFIRIRNGEMDDSYELNVSDQLSGDASMPCGFTYAGNGIAYAVIQEARDIEWEELNAGNHFYIAKIDLYSKTVTKLNIPYSNIRNVMEPLVDNGKLYYPVNIMGGASRIYCITVGGDANAFTAGAQLDGNNVFVESVIKNK